MSGEFENVQDDISNSLAAQLTDSLGVPDDAAVNQPLPERLADGVEEYDRHAVEHDARPEELIGEDDQPREPDRKVPLGALHQERSKRQALELQMQAQAQELAQYQQQLAQYQAYEQQLAQQAAQVQQEAAIPDFDEDPRGYIEAKERQFTQQLQNLQQAREYEQATAQLQHQVQETSHQMAKVEAEFAEHTPDYHQAYEHVHHTVVAELRQRYPQATDADISAMQVVAGLQFVQACKEQNINPAQRLYETALARGFNPGGARVPRQTRTPPTTLSSLPAAGRAPDERGKVTAKDVAGMSNDEFNRFFESMRDDATVRPAF